MWKISGITFIELMIVVAIVSILAAIAIVSYSSQTQRGRRIDAVNSILSISLAEERYRSNNSQYGTLAQVWGGVSSSSGGYYSIAITNVTATSYTITATAVGAQTNDKSNGISCTPLVFIMSNGTLTKTPVGCWPT